MNIAAKTEQFLVVDDVLSEEQFVALGRLMQMSEYHSVHSERWERTWRLSDGSPLAGEAAYSSSPSASVTNRADVSVFPTRTSIDFVFEALAKLRDETRELVGDHNTDWSVVSAKPFLYPAETAISWHADSSIYSGAYVFYAHPEWNCQWGGELLIASAECHEGANWDDSVSLVEPDDEGGIASIKKVPIGPHLRNRRENELLGKPGLGTYIFPKPNRLVVLAGGHHHRVVRIDRTAGAHVRWSVAGFFFRPDA